MTSYLTDLINLRVELAEDFTVAERYVLTVGFKNYIGQFQIGARVCQAVGKTEKYFKYKEVLPRYKHKVYDRLKDESLKIAKLFKEEAYKVASDNTSMAFFNKVVGDYYRYALEGLTLLIEEKKEAAIRQKQKAQQKKTENSDDEKKEDTNEDGTKEDKAAVEDENDGYTMEELKNEFDEIKAKALKVYSYAQHKAEKNLMSAHPVRLGIALNFAVFKFEIGDEQEAVNFAKKAIDVAMKKIDSVKDE